MPYEDPLKEYFKQNPEKKLKLFKIYTNTFTSSLDKPFSSNNLINFLFIYNIRY